MNAFLTADLENVATLVTFDVWCLEVVGSELEVAEDEVAEVIFNLWTKV